MRARKSDEARHRGGWSSIRVTRETRALLDEYRERIRAADPGLSFATAKASRHHPIDSADRLLYDALRALMGELPPAGEGLPARRYLEQHTLRPSVAAGAVG